MSPTLCTCFLCVLQLITEQAAFTLPRGAEIEGTCGSTESEIQISWKNNAYTLRIYFSKVGESTTMMHTVQFKTNESISYLSPTHTK